MSDPRLTTAQERWLGCLRVECARNRSGWAEYFEVQDEYGRRMPATLMFTNSNRTSERLRLLGLIEFDDDGRVRPVEASR